MITKAFIRNVIVLSIILGGGVGLLFWYDHQQDIRKTEGGQGATLRDVFMEI
ncbi:MAG: hypothetical protein LRY41_01980 [Candidatus Pacebacteria bacterium]|nr:hypothetical protein [Candidatus Paceibacterota bacterium]MCD8507988.1 hypothetical protein [Candidatus Paceibacterota bacterium]MCD8528077.1 hypothetical protein [Candidatus Paceibacterota bacterium]MCD8564034.1 hypothetical protein [Candidatus Paceibacterota bacterium]